MTTSDDRRPAAEAGRADDDGGDVYRLAAEAYDRRDDPADLEPPRSPDVLANHPSFRAAIDAARAPLLARASEDALRIEGLAAAVNRSHNHCISRADLLAVRAERDQARAQLAEVTRQRDEARAKAVDGGQVSLMTAVAGMHRRIAAQHEQITNLVGQHMTEIAKELERVGRLLPTEPVTDDGAAP